MGPLIPNLTKQKHCSQGTQNKVLNGKITIQLFLQK